MTDTDRSFTAFSKPEQGDSETREPAPKRGSLDLQDGALGLLFLLVLSSFCGALIAVYWPFAQGQSEGGMGDRVSTLETKVDEIAAGHASRAAAQAFAGARSDLAMFRSRLDADEARLAV